MFAPTVDSYRVSGLHHQVWCLLTCLLLETLKGKTQQCIPMYTHWHSNMAMENGTTFHRWIIYKWVSRHFPWLCRPKAQKYQQKTALLSACTSPIGLWPWMGCLPFQDKPMVSCEILWIFRGGRSGIYPDLPFSSLIILCILGGYSS